ncbi:hypothetical protein RJT30_00675 [Buchnera aphidicola (Mollitrichosiphum nigrofasciatum)]
MKNIKIIIGLSNPIKIYNDTRHNVGAWYVQGLMRKHSGFFKKKNMDI